MFGRLLGLVLRGLVDWMDLHSLGLGRELDLVEGFEELERLKEEVKGK